MFWAAARRVTGILEECREPCDTMSRTVPLAPTRCAAEANSHPCADEAISRPAPTRRSGRNSCTEPGLVARMVAARSDLRQADLWAPRSLSRQTAQLRTPRAAQTVAAVAIQVAHPGVRDRDAAAAPTMARHPLTAIRHRHSTPPLHLDDGGRILAPFVEECSRIPRRDARRLR